MLRDIIVSIAIYGNTPAAPLRKYRGGRIQRGHSGSYSPRITTDNSAVAKRRNPYCLRKAYRRILGGPKASFNKVEISLLLNGRLGRDLYVTTFLIDIAFYTYYPGYSYIIVDESLLT
jgi:hypothetical protein